MKYIVAIDKENGEFWANRLGIKKYIVISEVSDLENKNIDYRIEDRFIFLEGEKYGTPEVKNGVYNPNFYTVSELVEDRIEEAINGY